MKSESVVRRAIYNQGKDYRGKLSKLELSSCPHLRPTCNSSIAQLTASCHCNSWSRIMRWDVQLVSVDDDHNMMTLQYCRRSLHSCRNVGRHASIITLLKTATDASHLRLSRKHFAWWTIRFSHCEWEEHRNKSSPCECRKVAVNGHHVH